MNLERSRLLPALTLVCFFAVMLVLVSACAKAPETDGTPQPAVQGEAIQFAQESAQLKAIGSQPAEIEQERAIVASGRLVWDEGVTSRVFAPVAGRIVSVDAKPGDRVRKGQVLARLTSPEFGQALAEARRAKADLTASERSLRRVRELAEGGVAARKDVDAAEADYARTAAEIERTSGRLQAWGALGAQDQVFVLTSPLEGVVVERNANVGQEFRPDQSAGTSALFVVSDPRRLWAQIDVPEGALGLVSAGQEIRISADAVPDTDLTARIEFVPDTLDPVTRTLRARASVPNPDRRFKAEMFVRGALRLAGSGSPVVPASSVLLVNGKHVAFVETAPGRFARRAVRAEDAGVERMRILDGVKAGEKVVVEGPLFLQQILAAGPAR